MLPVVTVVVSVMFREDGRSGEKTWDRSLWAFAYSVQRCFLLFNP